MAASPTTAVTEPNILEPMGSGVLIYDGDCGFCTASARWFVDRAGTDLGVEPWQSLDLSRYGLTSADTSAAAYWVAPGSEPLRGADAIAAAARHSKPSWLRAVGRVFATPPFSWLGRAIYPVIAKNRYRLPGSTNACRLD